nr:ATP-grasp domain-containing protein [Algoriphagus locisalis]
MTSIGSLVGQNVHDVLEFPEFRRRDQVSLIGTNSMVGSPNNFRCDKCYIVPNTNSPEFKERILEIIKLEKPSLILSGRDEDTETVATLLEEFPGLGAKMPYGRASTLKYALDKWESWVFCQKYNLPFAETFVLGKSGDFSQLEKFAAQFGFPLIAKPIQGFASKGVFFIRSLEDAKVVSEFPNYMFQEYLGQGESLDEYFRQLDGLTPLFAHAPNIYHHSCHTVIAPDGSFDPIFISRNEHESGTTVGFKKVQDPDLEELTKRFVAAFHTEGGFGPLTVQFRKDQRGVWKAQEMNMRTNGNTFPRFMMGQDDLGLILDGVLPEEKFPIFHAPEETHQLIIGKSLKSHIIFPEDLNQLQNEQVWSN